MTSSDLFAAHDRLKTVRDQVDDTAGQLEVATQFIAGVPDAAPRIWGGPAAERFAAGMDDHAQLLRPTVRDFDDAQEALDWLAGRANTLAEELLEAEVLVAQLGSRRSMLHRQMAGTAHDDPGRPQLESDLARLLGEQAAADTALRDLADRWEQATDQTAEQIDTAAAAVRRATLDLSVQTPANAPEQMTQTWSWFRSTAGGFLAAEIFRFWTGNDGGFPGQAIAGANYVRRTAFEWRHLYTQARRDALARGTLTQMPPGRTWANSPLIRRFAPALSSPAVQAFAKRAGVTGSLASGVAGTAALIREGNPAEAYRHRGAGYVADVAGVGFSYSTAAFLLAPNPVTAGAVVVTGVTWVGATAWDRRDRIRQGARDTLDRGAGMVRSAAGSAQNVASTVSTRATDVARSSVDKVGNVLDSGASMVASLNPF